MQSIESSYHERQALDLPANLLAARIDKDALALLEISLAKAYACLPWRLEQGTLVALLADDLYEDDWNSRVEDLSVRWSSYQAIERVEFRSSGLDTQKQREAVDFLYRRADSNISCVNMFEFVCPMQWQNLDHTGDPYTRHCDRCDRNVHLVANEQEFQNRAQTGDCVAYVAPQPLSGPPVGLPDMVPQPIMAGAPMPHDFYNEPPPLGGQSTPPPPKDEDIQEKSKSSAWWNPLNLFRKKK